MKNNIYALLVALDEYDSDSNVRSLNGCVPDIEAMSEFLKKNYEVDDSHIIMLKNEQATKKNIIDTFLSHLCDSNKIKEGDNILFYFSGHGSTANSPDEFGHFDLEKTDETLVCYDSRLEGNYDLADKEIAFLLSKIPNNPQIVLIADSCHSGSITRDIINESGEIKTLDGIPSDVRALKGRKNKRSHSLQSYFFNEESNHYTNLIQQNKRFQIPDANYIAFSACNRNEYARERYGRGVFSYYLLEILKKAHNKFSYRKLFQLTYAQVMRKSFKQTPQLLSFGNFDPRKVFFSKEVMHTIPQYTVEHKKDRWVLNHGAIYGFPMDPQIVEKTKIGIYKKENTSQKYNLWKTVSVINVGLKECHLDFSYDNHDTIFQADMFNHLPTAIIHLDGSKTDIDLFKSKLDDLDQSYNGFNRNQFGLKYRLALDAYTYKIVHINSNKLIHGCVKTIPDAEKYILDKFRQLTKYDSIRLLQNTKTKLNKLNLDFCFAVEKPIDNPIQIPGDYINLDFSEEDIPYQMQVRNKSKIDLYVALLNITNKYGLKNQSPCLKIPKASDGKKDNWLIVDNNNLLNILDPEQKKVVDTFKLIVSTKPFEEYMYAEEDIEPIIHDGLTRGSIERGYDKPIEEDWYTKTIRVELNRK